MALSSKDLETAAKKATAWLAAQQTEAGNYRGIEPPNADGLYPDTDDIGCYYKSVYTLRAAGQSAAAGRMMQHAVKRFRSDEGDYFNSPEVRSSGSYGPYFCQIYQNAWLMRGATALRRWGLAKDILAFMNTQRDPKSGAAYTHVNSTTGILDSNSTAVNAYCNLLGGESEMAQQGAEFLLRLLGNQSDDGILWSRCDADAMPMTDLSEIPEKNHRYVRVSADEPEQAFWIWSWPMNLFIAMYELSDDRRYFDAALRVFDFLCTCHEHAFAFTTSGKSAWAAAKLFRLTGEQRFYEKAMSQMQYILDHQHADGFMLGDDAKELDDQPIRTTFDFTADFGSWLIDNAAEFASTGR